MRFKGFSPTRASTRIFNPRIKTSFNIRKKVVRQEKQKRNEMRKKVCRRTKNGTRKKSILVPGSSERISFEERTQKKTKTLKLTFLFTHVLVAVEKEGSLIHK